MLPSLLKTTAASALLLSVVSRVAALDNITIPDTVQAGQNVQVTLTNDLASSGSDSFDAGFLDYSVFLAVTLSSGESGPICVLVNSSAMDVTDLTIQIPASVGPDDLNYSLLVVAHNSDLDPDDDDSEPSNNFTLTGGTGTWLALEGEGYSLGYPERIPCTAIDCARGCNEKFDPLSFLNDNNVTDYESTFKCVTACPGVTYPSWESFVSEYDEFNSDDGNSTAAASSSVTGLATGVSTTHSTATASSSLKSTSTSATKTSTSSSSTATNKTSGAASGASLSTSVMLVTLLAGLIASARL